jgi:hypothetical protein
MFTSYFVFSTIRPTAKFVDHTLAASSEPLQGSVGRDRINALPKFTRARTKLTILPLATLRNARRKDWPFLA